jgi:hypothetical protein
METKINTDLALLLRVVRTEELIRIGHRLDKLGQNEPSYMQEIFTRLGAYLKTEIKRREEDGE